MQQKLRSDNNRSLAAADRSERVATRMANIEANERDPLAYERVLGQINLCPINFLARGLDAAKSVARLTVQSEDGNSTWHGTGFLVAPGVLVTNNHVISTRRQAAMAIAEFDYQRDISGTPEAIRTFTLLESEIFFTDERMDVTFVAIAPRASDGTPLSRFGHLPLIRPSGKAINGEYVSIIQHPGGGEKQITIRESRLLVPELDEAELSDGATSLADIDFETFIHYSTDTQPGSSGSPVLNDQWQVVAIHHSAVP
ncbi:MAG TPA: serine protease, partial [Rhizobiaceae bacterium]|nr:serine protease [Rhizobiaceae bacterium]